LVNIQLFENIPFKKSTVGASIVAIVGGGAGLVYSASKFQNYKHGFTSEKKKCM
jgi:hypothetical protein